MLKLLTIALVFVSACAFGQKSPTYVSVEGGGNGIIGSVNVAKAFILHPDFEVIFQWGIGWSPDFAQANIPINLPVQVVCKFGKHNFFLETGVGSTLIFGSTLNKSEDEKAGNEVYLSPIVGFRHESRNWFGRIYACPLIHVTGENLHDDLTSNFVKIGVGVGVIF